MSIKLVQAVYELDLNCTYERHFLARLADRIDAKGYCYPSVNSLARDMCCSVRKVQGVQKELEERGLITIERNAGPRLTNIYRLTFAPAEGAPPQPVHLSTADTQPPHATTNPPARGADEPKKKLKETSPRAKQKSPVAKKANPTIQAIKARKSYLTTKVSDHQVREWISEGELSEQEARDAGFL